MSTGKTHKEYEQRYILPVRVAFNRNTEPELVRWMEKQPNRSGYIKKLVQRDYAMEREKLLWKTDRQERATRTAR